MIQHLMKLVKKKMHVAVHEFLLLPLPYRPWWKSLKVLVSYEIYKVLSVKMPNKYMELKYLKKQLFLKGKNFLFQIIHEILSEEKNYSLLQSSFLREKNLIGRWYKYYFVSKKYENNPLNHTCDSFWI